MGGEYFGKYGGIVKDNSDGHNLGHLQVSVPALFPPNELVEARPALPYGLFFVPEKEQRVWVEFEGGDPGLPLWTGVQSIPGSWPDEAKADPPQKRVLKTASGHLVVFDDKSGEEGIQIKDGVHGHAVTVDKDGIDVKHGGAGHEITMTSDGITVKHGSTNDDLKLDSSGLTLETATGAKVSVTSSGITIDAGTTSVQVNGKRIALGAGSLPVVRLTDSGVGNLGAPVVMTVTSNPQTFA